MFGHINKNNAMWTSLLCIHPNEMHTLLLDNANKTTSVEDSGAWTMEWQLWWQSTPQKSSKWKNITVMQKNNRTVKEQMHVKRIQLSSSSWGQGRPSLHHTTQWSTQKSTLSSDYIVCSTASTVSGYNYTYYSVTHIHPYQLVFSCKLLSTEKCCFCPFWTEQTLVSLHEFREQSKCSKGFRFSKNIEKHCHCIVFQNASHQCLIKTQKCSFVHILKVPFIIPSILYALFTLSCIWSQNFGFSAINIPKLFIAVQAYARAVLGVVILSVRLSVTRVHCDKTRWCTADIFIPHEKAITLLLW